MKKLKLILSYGAVLILLGCASNSADLDSSIDPEPSVSAAAALKKQAEKQQADLLSYREYAKADNNLRKAQQGLSGSYDAKYIVEKAEIAKTDFQKALKLSQSRTPNATRIMLARRSSLDAGLRNSATLVAALAKVDDDLRDETDNFARKLGPKKFSQFQKRYLALEIKAVQFRELETVNKSIKKASRADAGDLAPDTLEKALLDVSEAENLIAQSPRDPSVYKGSVKEAVASSVLLSDVMDVILNARGTPEKVALQIVQQNRELTKLSKNVGKLEKNLQATESNLKASESNLMKTEGALKTQNAELKSTKSNLMQTESALMKQNQVLEKTSIQVRFQKAMDEAVTQFSDDEAEVYQRGNKLIFRLKRINFASGTATIPQYSKPLLAKINNIIKTLGAETVDVLGHTDSVGPDDLNSKLSNDRALAVANYLSTLGGGYKLRYKGHGESRPIASNETTEGRAINRRVDLEVTARKISG